MPSDTILHFEFVPPVNILDTLRVHLRLALMARKARRNARRDAQSLASLDPYMLYDIGATDILPAHARRLRGEADKIIR